MNVSRKWPEMKELCVVRWEDTRGKTLANLRRMLHGTMHRNRIHWLFPKKFRSNPSYPLGLIPGGVLQKGAKHLAPSLKWQQVSNVKWAKEVISNLQERMTSNNTQEPLQAFSPRLDDLIWESVGKNLAWKRGDIDSCGFMFKNIAESFEIRVAPANYRMAKLESRYVCLTVLVISRWYGMGSGCV